MKVGQRREWPLLLALGLMVNTKIWGMEAFRPTVGLEIDLLAGGLEQVRIDPSLKDRIELFQKKQSWQTLPPTLGLEYSLHPQWGLQGSFDFSGAASNQFSIVHLIGSGQIAMGINFHCQQEQKYFSLPSSALFVDENAQERSWDLVVAGKNAWQIADHQRLEAEVGISFHRAHVTVEYAGNEFNDQLQGLGSYLSGEWWTELNAFTELGVVGSIGYQKLRGTVADDPDVSLEKWNWQVVFCKLKVSW